MVDERLKSKEWRLSHLYRIVDKNKKLIIFRKNAIQQQYDEMKWLRNIVLKARQEGFTTFACIDGLDDVLFHKNFTMVIIAHEKDAVKKIFRKVKKAWEHFPQALKDELGLVSRTDNKNELSFNNGSSLSVALSSRSDTVNRLHISEFGKICAKYPLKAEEIITGAFPSVPGDGRIDIESTAEGEFGAFHDMFWEAWDRGQPNAKKLFKSFFFGWQMHTDYRLEGEFDIPSDLKQYQSKHKLTDKQINWYFIERQTLKDKMKQENPTTPEEAFESSGVKMFSTEAIEWQKQWVEDGIKIGDWIIYKFYNPSHRYGLGADVAEGLGQDSSTAKVLDYTTGEEVATYANNMIAPDLFGHELAWGSRKYGDCLIAPERNNHGHTTIATLKTLKANLYEEIKEGEVEERATKKYGWLSTGASKPLMLFDLNEALNEHNLKIHEKATQTELRTYDKQDLTEVHFNAEQSKHWDRVIALGIAWQMRKHALGKVQLEETTEKPFNPYSPL